MANRFLSLDEVVSEAMSVIPNATTEDYLWAKQWAYIALRECGPSADNIGVEKLYVEDLLIRKPDDFYKSLDIALYTIGDQQLNTKYRAGTKRVHQQNIIYTDLGSKPDPFISYIEISEDDRFFHLSSNAVDASYALLRYFKLPVDSDNNPQFPEATRLAIMLFIRYMWSLRNGLNRLEVAFNKASWDQAKLETRAKLRPPTGLSYKQIMKEWNSMIPNYRFDRF